MTLRVLVDRICEDPVVALVGTRRLLAAARSLPEGDRILRIYHPSPTVAFGSRDTRSLGYASAVASSRRWGFAAVNRMVGGRAAAYHQHSLVMEIAGGARDPHTGSRARFVDHAEVMVRTLGEFGVDARIGELAGEYCPGEFSVNARGKRKLVGAAQRIVPGAWLLSAVVQVGDRESLLRVTSDVYDDLALPWQPETLGVIEDEAPGITVDEVASAILGSYREGDGVLASVEWVDLPDAVA